MCFRFVVFAGIRKRSLERQDSSVLYDDYYGDPDASESLYPTRSSFTQDPTQSVNKYDYSYGLDRQWNTNSVSYNSHLPSKGKLLPKVPIKSYNVINHRESVSTFLNDAVPIASGSGSNINTNSTSTAAAATAATTKRARQLPQPGVTTRKRLPRAGQARLLPQMPTNTKSVSQRCLV